MAKMAKWSGVDTGILRKRPPAEKLEELLVFGYACKLFRDDEKALYIDQGKHLIPWMGDDKLKIDRYDCRGALSDLSPYESSREGYDAMRWLGLNESERKIEQLCDEERYHALNTNEDEEEMYKEEELKRLQQKTNEFAYSYDVPRDPDVSGPSNVEEEDERFSPSSELNVPADITIPKTEKENARIEKTAHFVSKQGPQMEILIKAKQADNRQFSFLNQSDPLYKYYKHVLSAIKAKTYKIESLAKDEEPRHEESGEHDSSSDGSYLHPSLQTSSVQSSVPYQVPSVVYKPTADCSYSQLVNRIQGSESKSDVQNLTQLSYEQQQQQYYQYYYAMQYYEYYKQMAAQFHSMGDTDGQTIPPHIQEQMNAQATAFAHMAYAQYVQQNANNSYAQIVSNLSQNKDGNGAVIVGNISKAPVLYGQEPAEPDKVTLAENDLPAKQPKKALLSLAHYGTDSDDDDDNEDESAADVFPIPPDETKVIVEKMASYVSKNGTDFENIVQAKGDPRFQFLNETHEYYKYYRHKVAEFATIEATGVTKELKNETETTVNAATQSAKLKEKKIIAPVSFSIKKPKEEIPKDIKSALPLEETDDEDDQSRSDQNDEPDAIVGSSTPPLPSAKPDEIISASAACVQPETTEVKLSSPTDVNRSATTDDPILEMIDLTDDAEERKDAKRAEDKIKDKLAAAAREKLASAGKDRALQMERKKKAAAFLKLKSVDSTVVAVENKTDDKVLVISDSENREVKVRHRHRSRDKHSRKKGEESDTEEEGEIKKSHKKSSKKKRSHKRKHSRSRHESKHKKSKRRRRRSDSKSSTNS